MNSLRKSDPEILSSLLEEIKNLKVHTDKRYGKARKKPLLVLLIVAKIARKEIIQNQFYFSKFEKELSDLIYKYGLRPQPKSQACPEQPFAFLASSSFWEIKSKEPYKRLSDISLSMLRENSTYAKLKEEYFILLKESFDAVEIVIDKMLEHWWPKEYHERIKKDLGIFPKSKVSKMGFGEREFSREVKMDQITDYLVSLSASSRHSVVTEKAQSKLQKDLYIETDLDYYLVDELCKEDKEKWDLIILAGNAGDGKSALIQYLYEVIKGEEEKYNLNWDATHSNNPDENQIDILGEFFHFFQDPNFERRPEKTNIIAMNTGMIVSFFEKIRESEVYSFDILREIIYNFLDLGKISSSPNNVSWKILLVNLDQRNILSYSDEEETVFSKMVEKINVKNPESLLYAPYKETCLECKEKGYCPISFNLEALTKKRVKTQLEKILFKISVSEDIHITPRAAWDFLFNAITGGEIPKGKEGECPYLSFVENCLRENDFWELGENIFFQNLFNKNHGHDLIKHFVNQDPCLVGGKPIDEYGIQISLKPQLDDIDGLDGLEPDLLLAIRDNVNTEERMDGRKYSVFGIRRQMFFPSKQEIAECFGEFDIDFKLYHEVINEYLEFGLKEINGSKQSFFPALEALIENLNTAIVKSFGGSHDKYFEIQDFRNTGQFRLLVELKLPEDIMPKVDLKIKDPRYYQALFFKPREISVEFKEGIDHMGTFNINFGLFKLLLMIRDGYNPSSVDLGRFYHFKFFCNQLFTQLAEKESLKKIRVLNRSDNSLIFLSKPYGLKTKFEVIGE